MAREDDNAIEPTDVHGFQKKQCFQYTFVSTQGLELVQVCQNWLIPAEKNLLLVVIPIDHNCDHISTAEVQIHCPRYLMIPFELLYSSLRNFNIILRKVLFETNFVEMYAEKLFLTISFVLSADITI
jgi:hypothetical protein